MIADVTLDGDKVRLRPTTADDLPHFVRWLSDPEVTQHLGSDVRFQPPTMEDEERWFQDTAQDPNKTNWTIEAKSGLILGSIDLRNISTSNAWGELGILIGDKHQWDKGYGTDAVRTLVRYAFEELRLHRVQLTVSEENKRGIKCYWKCGFIREGMLYENRKRPDGTYANTVMMGILNKKV
jgi:RimJ/RimL family protein N-acetyltransferase